MLRIKDEVDLKELEKFDFTFDDGTGEWFYYERNLLDKTYIKINSWNRKIKTKITFDSDQLCLDLLYDLIQAGLVEKV